MDKNAQIKEVTLRGFYNESSKVFRVAGVVSPEEQMQPRKHNVKRNWFKDVLGDAKEVVGYTIKRAIKDVQIKFLRAKEGLGVPLFCDIEGKVYFFDEEGVQHFISEDNQYSLTERGEYYKITQTDEGFNLDLIPALAEAFPFKMVSKPKEEEFDFDDLGELEPLEEVDPFAPKKEKNSNVIDLDAARFMREREGRGR